MMHQSPIGRLAGGAAVLAVVGLLVLVVVLGNATAAPRPALWNVLAIKQSSYVTEQSTFTVSLEVANPANIQLMYFSFCQLTKGLCYTPPITMVDQAGTNWFVGTTNRMTSYAGMTVGVRAGYNITIEYANQTNVTEPTMPNPFTNLTVASSVTDEYMFEMTVMNQEYGLSGVISNSQTGAPIPGASVSLSPGNDSPTTTSATGVYSFAGLPNGTYAVSVSEEGVGSGGGAVTISGSNVSQDFEISNGSSPPTQPTAGSGGSSMASIADLSLYVIVPVVAIVIGLLLFSRARKRKARGPPPSDTATADVAASRPKS
jgi:hypothetical protein